MRQELKLFTNIAYFIALATIILIPVCFYILSITSDGSMASFLKLLVSLTFLASMVGIPLSVVSMFSKEKLSKRIFVLVVNVLPICLILFGLMMEIFDEFFKTGP